MANRSCPVSTQARIKMGHAAFSWVSNRLKLAPQGLVFGGLFMRRLHTAKNTPSFRVVKRVFDMAISTLGVVAFSPLFVLTGLLILISMGRPVILSQRRVGRGGRTIYVYKFKTRRNPVDINGRPLSLRERSTHVGRALRARRLDELPQLFNVIKGDMAIVGPRPLPPVDQPAEPSLRLAMAPGLTGWAKSTVASSSASTKRTPWTNGMCAMRAYGWTPRLFGAF